MILRLLAAAVLAWSVAAVAYRAFTRITPSSPASSPGAVTPE